MKYTASRSVPCGKRHSLHSNCGPNQEDVAFNVTCEDRKAEGDPFCIIDWTMKMVRCTNSELRNKGEEEEENTDSGDDLNDSTVTEKMFHSDESDNDEDVEAEMEDGWSDD